MKEKSVPALHFHNLTVNYDKTPVLWDVSFSVASGNIIGIVGPNGAGKSTLIKAALGILKPISGCIEFFGKPLRSQRQRVAYVPQRETVDWDFPITARELVLMGRYGRLGLFRWPRKADKIAAEGYLDLLGMLPYADRQISQLSGGQQQRVFIARALLQEADIYFMDEPFAGVDMATEKVLMDQLRDLKNEGKTVFVVHHDLNTVESYFDLMIIINMRLIAMGKTAEVFNSDNLTKAYGKNSALFDDAFRLSQNKIAGIL